MDKRKTLYHDTKRAGTYDWMQTHEQRIIDLASEKGASSWLTSLPLADFGFVLNKQEFHDAILLRYNFKVKGVAAACACGEQNTGGGLTRILPLIAPNRPVRQWQNAA